MNIKEKLSSTEAMMFVFGAFAGLTHSEGYTTGFRQAGGELSEMVAISHMVFSAVVLGLVMVFVGKVILWKEQRALS
jgi:hypothetical protein